jgi:hypothetical protein
MTPSKERTKIHEAGKRVVVHTCLQCGNEIEKLTGLCGLNCKYDLELHRPKGAVRICTYERVDTLVKEEIV